MFNINKIQKVRTSVVTLVLSGLDSHHFQYAESSHYQCEHSHYFGK